MDAVSAAFPEVEAQEADAEFITLATLNKGVTLRLAAPLELGTGPARADGAGNLFVCSNLFGWILVADNRGLRLFSLPAVRTAFATAAPHSVPTAAPHLHVPLPSRVDFIRLASSEKLVVVGMSDGSIGLWGLRELVQGSLTPLHLFPPGAPLVDLLPCPAEASPLLLVLKTTGLELVSLTTFQPLTAFAAGADATSASWSVKGKQIAVGLRGGQIVQYTPEGEKKSEIPAPGTLEGAGFEVRSIHWLENYIFIATYAKPTPAGASPIHEDEVYSITKDPTGGVKEFTRFNDPTPAFGMMEREGRRWIVDIKGWNPFKHLLFMANTPSGDIGALGQLESSAWATLNLPESCRPSVPLTELDSSDTCTVGLELDLSFFPVPKVTPLDAETGHWGDAEEKAGPRLMVYTSDGVLGIWRIENELGGAYPGGIHSRDILTASSEAISTPSIAPPAFSAPTPSAFGAFGAPSGSPFAVAPSPSPFAAPSTGFGAPAFGTAPAFGAPAAFGAPSAFGTPKPFGAPATFGGSAFGASAFGGAAGTFGSAAKSTTPPVVASPSSGGFAGFGSSAATPLAAATTAPSAFAGFGSAAPMGFGGAAKPAAFGSGSSFGAGKPFGTPAAAFGTPSSTFGTSAFGSPAPAAPSFGAPAAMSSAPSTGAFGAFSSSTGSSGFASFAPAATSPFAQSTSSPFGGASPFAASPTPFGAYSTPLFGGPVASASTTVSGSTSAFSAKPTGGFSFGSSGAPFAPSNDRRTGDESEEEEEMEEQDDGRVRGDDPPDLEPTVTGRDFSEPAPAAAAPSAFGFGGLGFGAPSPAAVVVQAPSTIFGTPVPLQTPVVPVLPAAAVVVKVATTVAFGFGSATAFPPSTSAFGTSSPFGAPAASAFGSTGFAFGSKPSIYATPVLPPPVPTATIEELPVVEELPSPVPTAAISPPLPFPVAAPRAKTPEPVARPVAVKIEGEDDVPRASAKSLFGFASSPPPSSPAALAGRAQSDGEEGEEEEEEYDEEDEGGYLEGDESDGEESAEHEAYDEDALYDEAERTTAFDDSVKLEELSDEDRPASFPPPKSANPLLARLDSKVSPLSSTVIGQSTTPAGSPSREPTPVVPPVPAAAAPVPTRVAPPPFSFTSFQPPSPSPSPPLPPAPVAPAKPSLSGFGPAPVMAKPSSFFGFNSAAPRASSPLSMPSSTSTAPPMSFGGIVPPTLLPAGPTKPAFSLGSFSTIPAAAVALPPSEPQTPTAFHVVNPFLPPTTGSVTPAPAPETPRKTFSLGTSTTPKLSDKLGTTPAVDVQEPGMAGEFLRTFQVLEQEFKLLRSNTVLCKTFVAEIGQPCQSAGPVSTYDEDSWSLGDLAQLQKMTTSVSPQIRALVDAAITQKRQVAELQGLMLKAETKREEAARFIRARSDPVFAKMVRVRQLGPEQLENQKRIRAAVEAARTRLEQIEEHVGLIKDKIMESRLGRSSFKTPSLDAVNRTVRNISGAILEKTTEIDELSLRLGLLRVAASAPPVTPSKSTRHRSASVDDTLATSTLQHSPGVKPAPNLHPNAVATANAALLAERNAAILKRALLSVRSTPLLNKSALRTNQSSSQPISDLQLAFAAGPITGDRLPLPRRPVVPPPAPSRPASVQSTSAAVPWSFSSPVALADPALPALKAPSFISFGTPSLTTQPSVHGSTSSLRGGPLRSTRQHASSVHSTALSLKTTNAYNKSFVSPSSSFDWGTPPPPPAPAPRREYVSFEGLQAPELVKIEPSSHEETGGDGEGDEEEEGDEHDEDYDEEDIDEDGEYIRRSQSSEAWDEEDFEQGEFGSADATEALDDIAEEDEEE